jgi:cyanophycinase
MARDLKQQPQTNVRLEAAPCNPKGTLIIIGGHEAKEGTRPILELIAKRAGRGKLVVLTIASEEPNEQWENYHKTFRDLGVPHLEQFDARSREELIEKIRPEQIDEDTVVFFAGGDQMQITSKFGGTALCDRVRELYSGGLLIAGTSSGASVMSEVMMSSGEGESSHQTEASLKLAPGLGFISGVIIDQHFAERGRMGRLLAAVGQNPRLLGIGIDEDTAMVLEGHEQAAVLGSGAVYIVDGRPVTHSRIGQGSDQALSLFGVALHVLSSGDRFDLTSRRATAGRTEDIESQLVEAR